MNAAHLFPGDRQFNVGPGHAVTSVTDKTAVILAVGPVAIGMTVAEARSVAFQLAGAADTIELLISTRKQV